ncbi:MULTISPECIES: putative bifunctional diguanylate cyclase/phosphodiesterase [unclassified Janthinobacterium]|uniref:putative bifunctional diguanylate cyclase/phosphodiesterase n=1 Tax=unclassified Janthinobacterium TaxID=2610881 RepID=UPI000344E805|nr:MULTISPECIES: EAL domain-containing protein [unclassified Janthinobacterium]MEC5159881.1 diguanylate cyclase (GGDEF)-like protein/PAS domain S-box-containing protein [Janthinobacterium sp. CG_S6]
MTLSDFIRARTDSILEQWEQFAKQIPSARGMDTEALRDHARGILGAIADDLDQAQSDLQQDEKSKGRGPRGKAASEAEMHGAARVAEGFSINDAMAEYRALRASVLRLWRNTVAAGERAAVAELTRFNEALDQALSESLARYASDSERFTRLFDTLLSSSPDLNYIFDLDGRLIYANKALTNVYQRSLQQIVGKTLAELGAPAAADLRQYFRRVIDGKLIHRDEMPYPLEGGDRATCATYDFLLVPVTNRQGKVEAIAGSARDVTERKQTEQRIRRSATYDFLTNLPNRSLFRDRLEQEVKRAGRSGLPLALFFIDLDGFKEVNDRLGHDAGDQLLRQVAQRISACVRDTDTVARLGGDEFTVILGDVSRIGHVEILAQAILDALALPFKVRNKEVQISCSIGITLYPQDAHKPENLLGNADQAMYVAKNSGRNRFSFFTAGMREAAWVRLKMIDELRRALSQQQLAVYYQPIVDLARGGIVKAEALLRWRHPQTGLMLPDKFIGLAEETGLIGEIGDWVLGQAAATARQWGEWLGAPFQISVNKSPVEFMSKARMKNWDTYLARSGPESNCLSVEITEGVLLSDLPWVRTKLDDLHSAGIELAIDDFGTGYSSLAYLKKFKVDYLKIDQSFVQDTAADGDSRVFAETIIVMAHKLGLKVIAEGVETAEQRHWLKTAGCDYAQGFLFSAALPPHDFALLLGAGKGPRERVRAPPAPRPTR